MNVEELKGIFRKSTISLEKRVSSVKEFVLELSEEERKNLAGLYELSTKALHEENSVTKAGIRLSGRCYIDSQRVPYTLFHEIICAAAGQEIKSPSKELESYRKENRTKTRNPFKRHGILAERKRRRMYGKGSSNDHKY